MTSDRRGLVIRLTILSKIHAQQHVRRRRTVLVSSLADRYPTQDRVPPEPIGTDQPAASIERRIGGLGVALARAVRLIAGGKAVLVRGAKLIKLSAPNKLKGAGVDSRKDVPAGYARRIACADYPREVRRDDPERGYERHGCRLLVTFPEHGLAAGNNGPDGMRRVAYIPMNGRESRVERKLNVGIVDFSWR